jgi:hypothetical protein
MKPGKAAFVALLLLGIAVFFVCLLADVVGITADHEFGPKQQLGTMLGVLMTGAGVGLLRKPS